MFQYHLLLLSFFLVTASSLRLSPTQQVGLLLEVRGGSQSNSIFGTRAPARVSPKRAGSSSSSPVATKQFVPDSSVVGEGEDVSTKEVIDSFLTRDSRNSFIARVYAILSAQLAVTTLSCILFGLHPGLSNLRYNTATPLPLIGAALSTVSFYTVLFRPNARRKNPNKFVWLSLFTVGEAITVGFITSFFKFQSVILSMAATALATISVSAYTVLQKNPNRDLSTWGKTLSTWAIILIVYLLIGICQQVGFLPAGFLPYSQTMYSFFAAILFSAFLAYDTALVMGGKHSKYRLHEKDYVLGSMILYSDIVGLFLQLLYLLGSEKE